MIPKTHPLYMVNDVFNAVFVKGNMVGDVMFYGRGAGKLPTASAMVAVMIDAARHDRARFTTFWSRENVELSDAEEMKLRYFVKLEGEKAVTACLVKEVFGEVEEVTTGNHYAFITPYESKNHLDHTLEEIKGCKVVTKIRIEK